MRVCIWCPRRGENIRSKTLAKENERIPGELYLDTKDFPGSKLVQESPCHLALHQIFEDTSNVYVINGCLRCHVYCMSRFWKDGKRGLSQARAVSVLQLTWLARGDCER